MSYIEGEEVHVICNNNGLVVKNNNKIEEVN